MIQVLKKHPDDSPPVSVTLHKACSANNGGIRIPNILTSKGCEMRKKSSKERVLPQNG